MSEVLGKKELEEALIDVISSDNNLDSLEFDPIEYINRQLLSEQSLSTIDSTIDKLNNEIHSIDEEILKIIREQAQNNRQYETNIDEAQEAINDLRNRIVNILEKAKESQTSHQKITDNIKCLDEAKKRVTSVILSLKRLVMLVAALDELRGYAVQREYKMAANIVLAVQQLSTYFTSSHFSDIQTENLPRLTELLQKKNCIFSELQKQILEDFDTVFDPDMEQIPNLKDACMVIDTFQQDRHVKHEIINQFCLKYLDDYKRLFQPPEEASKLENIERRYTWLKRLLADYEANMSGLFPAGWFVECYVCEHFCHITRQHLVEVLGACYMTVDVKLLVQALYKSIEFEDNLNTRFNIKTVGSQRYVNELLSEVDLHATLPLAVLEYPEVLSDKIHEDDKKVCSKDNDFHVARFRGIISECFEAYLGRWIEYEENELLGLFHNAVSNDQIIRQIIKAPSRSNIDKETVFEEGFEEEEEDVPKCVYSSANEILTGFHACLKRAITMSTHQTLYDVFLMFSRIIRKYVDTLFDRLTPAQKDFGSYKLTNTLRKKQAVDYATILSDQDIIKVCYIIGTTDYIDSALPNLWNLILHAIDSTYKEKINFEDEKKRLWSLKTRCVELILKSCEHEMEKDPLSTLATSDWNSIVKVKERSPYVDKIYTILRKYLSFFRNELSIVYFRYLCDKVVQFFLPMFTNYIKKCKGISVIGAQQLLADTSAIKNILLDLPAILLTGKSITMSSGYSKFVLKEIEKVEAVLNILIYGNKESSELNKQFNQSNNEEVHELKQHNTAVLVTETNTPDVVRPSQNHLPNETNKSDINNCRMT